jgi:hypothetical protein
MRVALFFACMITCSQVFASDNHIVDGVRKANERFKDVNVAFKDGYTPIPCASGLTGGAMGVHYVNSDYLKDGVIDIAKPEAIMYEPQPDGSMELIARRIHRIQGARCPGRPSLQLCQRAQPLRARSVLRTPRLGLEGQSRRHLR